MLGGSVFSDLLFFGAYLGACGVLLAGCFCGDPHGYAEGNPRSKTLLDAWAWLVTFKIPQLAAAIVRKLPFGDAVVKGAEKAKDYVCYKPNPLLQIFYLAVVFGVIGIFLFEAYPYIPNNRLAWWHRYTGYLMMATALVSFVVASTTSPGASRAKLWRATTTIRTTIFYLWSKRARRAKRPNCPVRSTAPYADTACPNLITIARG